MYWIAVHGDVLGGKLRGLRKNLECSEAEALGILTIMWLWARKNTDKTGLLLNADRKDIAMAIEPYLSSNLSSDVVTEAMIDEGWIDEEDGQLYVHDWYEWQQYWFNFLDRKEKDRERKRREREKSKEDSAPEEKHEEKLPREPETPKQPAKPAKIKYAEEVRMYQEEHDKLVEKYGEPFVEKLIVELDNYKVANGKRYKSDYRAILNWVVEKCEKKYPQLAMPAASATVIEGNPFAAYK